MCGFNLEGFIIVRNTPFMRSFLRGFLKTIVLFKTLHKMDITFLSKKLIPVIPGLKNGI